MTKKLRCKVKHWDGRQLINTGDVIPYFEGYNPKMFTELNSVMLVEEDKDDDGPNVTKEIKVDKQLNDMTKNELFQVCLDIGLKVQENENKAAIITKINEFRKTDPQY